MNNKDTKNQQTEEGQVIAQRVAQMPNLSFADSTLVMTSKFDIKIYFGVSVPNQDGIGEVRYHTIMSMSPQLAKAMSNSLAKATAEYERDYMPLKMNGEK